MMWRELAEPWRNLPRTIALYAIAGVIGATILTALKVAIG